MFIIMNTYIRPRFFGDWIAPRMLFLFRCHDFVSREFGHRNALLWSEMNACALTLLAIDNSRVERDQKLSWHSQYLRESLDIALTQLLSCFQYKTF